MIVPPVIPETVAWIYELYTLLLALVYTIYFYIWTGGDISKATDEKLILKDLNFVYKMLIPAELIILFIYNNTEEHQRRWRGRRRPMYGFMSFLRMNAMSAGTEVEHLAILMLSMSVKPVLEFLICRVHPVDFLVESSKFNKTVVDWSCSRKFSALPIVIFGQYTPDKNMHLLYLGYWAQVILQGRILVSCTICSWLLMVRNTNWIQPDRTRNEFGVLEVIFFLFFASVSIVFFLGNWFL